MNSLKGYVLVASPQLQDPNFVRTVVLMLHHRRRGPSASCSNRPAENTVKQLWEKVGEGTCENEQLVHVGGPVSGPLMALHTDASAAEMEVFARALLCRPAREPGKAPPGHTNGPVRIFVGHAGWGEGQLERELQQGAWLTSPAGCRIRLSHSPTPISGRRSPSTSATRSSTTSLTDQARLPEIRRSTEGSLQVLCDAIQAG